MNTILNTSTRTPFRTLALSLVAGTLLGSLMANAAPASIDAAPTLVVKFDQQALSTEAGARALYRRIEAAADQVCPADSVRDLARDTAVRECRKQSVARALRQINDPRLAQLLGDAARHG